MTQGTPSDNEYHYTLLGIPCGVLLDIPCGVLLSLFENESLVSIFNSFVGLARSEANEAAKR